MQRRALMQWMAAAGIVPGAAYAQTAAALRPGKPFAGTTVNVLSVVDAA